MRGFTQESSCRGTQFLAFRSAVIAHWGEFDWMHVCQKLGEEASQKLLTREISPVEWIAERHMIELAEAVFQGPAASDEDVYGGFVDTMIGCGFGRVRRFFLRLAPPELLLRRAGELWAHDHTDGELHVDVADHAARVELRNHIHVTTHLGRLTARQSFSCALSRTRAQSVTAEHSMKDASTLEVRLSWT